MDGYVTRFQSFTPFRRDCSILRGRARKHKTLSVRRESHSGVDAPSSALKRAVNLVKTCESLIPYSDDSVNLGLLLWRYIDDVPAKKRVLLLKHLDNRYSFLRRFWVPDIVRLWKLAGIRYGARPVEVAASSIPEFSIWNDIHSAALFRGRAALPVRWGLDSFQKRIIFCGEEDQVYGRVFHGDAVRNRLYPGPLYFKAMVGTALVPLYSEMCDLMFTYNLNVETKGRLENLALGLNWVGPRQNPAPFDGDFVDYIRVVGPGVYVGLGYKEGDPSSPIPLFPVPLFFIMIAE